ncbi:hypothetical protein Daus18300_009895 [Diaporthe australafricana]|uniref:HD domain-containing protein n=1 Tax=Diaporthe australafricana TaxID=127596 RepID=A0ABR3WCG7_9PEZI
MSPEASLPNIPELRLELPSSKLFTAALLFAQKHCTAGIFNHVARSAYWALIITAKLPSLASSPPDMELVVVVLLLHDMGLADSASDALEGLSVNKRFEVDGANIARDFIRSHAEDEAWDEARVDRLWTAIVLHTTPSIALHAPPEVALTQMAVEADFAGPYWAPAGTSPTKGLIITVDEYRAVTKLFARVDFDREGVKKIMCGLCQKKPDTTYDNFVGSFGVKYGIDGEGIGATEYARVWEEKQAINLLLNGLDALEALELLRHLILISKSMDKATSIGIGAGGLAVAVAGKLGYDMTRDAQMLAKERDDDTIDQMTALARQNLLNARGKQDGNDKQNKKNWAAETKRFRKEMAEEETRKGRLPDVQRKVPKGKADDVQPNENEAGMVFAKRRYERQQTQLKQKKARENQRQIKEQLRTE